MGGFLGRGRLFLRPGGLEFRRQLQGVGWEAAGEVERRAVIAAQTRRQSCAPLASRDRFHVGSHYVPDAAVLRFAPKLIGRGQIEPTQIAERLDRDVHTDFAAELETVRDRPRGRKDTDADTFDNVHFGTAAEGGVGQKNKPEPQIIEPWTPRRSRHREPDLSGELRAEIVKAQRGKQAHHAVRNSFADFGEAMMLRHIRVGAAIKSTPVPHDQATGDQPRKLLAGGTRFFDFRGADQPPLLNEGQKPVCGWQT